MISDRITHSCPCILCLIRPRLEAEREALRDTEPDLSPVAPEPTFDEPVEIPKIDLPADFVWAQTFLPF